MSSSSSSGTKQLVSWLKWLVPLAVAFFIGRVIHSEWAHVRSFEWSFDPGFLLLSFVSTSCWYCVRAHVWRKILIHFGRPIPYREALRIFVLSELSRYVPGTVWQYFSRVYLSGLWNVPASIAVSSALMELLLMAVAAIPLILWNIGDVFPALGHVQIALVLTFIVGAGVVLQPRALNRLGRSLLPRLRLEYTPIRITFLETAWLWITCVLVWIAFGSGFVFFARSLTRVEFSDGLHIVSEYAASWLIGVVTIYAPAGLGVREGVLGFLLGKILPIGTALTIAVLSRIWLVFLELFWAAVSQFALRREIPKEAAIRS